MKLLVLSFPISDAEKLGALSDNKIDEFINLVKKTGKVTSLGDIESIQALMRDIDDSEIKLDWKNNHDGRIALIMDDDYDELINFVAKYTKINRVETNWIQNYCNMVLQLWE